MNPQQFNNKNIDRYKNILQNSLTNIVTFTGRSTVEQYWVTVLSFLAATLTVVFFSMLFAVLVASQDLATSTTAAKGEELGSMFWIWFPYFSLVALFSIGWLPLYTRRVRDLGFTNKGIISLHITNYIIAILAGYVISALWAIVLFIVLPCLRSNLFETKNNDSFSKFLFRQNPQAAAYYASQGQQNFNQAQFGQRPQSFNQPSVNNGQASQQGFNQTPANNPHAAQQTFNQVPVNNSQVTQQSFNQAPVNNEPAVKTPVQPATPANNRPVVQEAAPVKKEEVVTQAPVQESVKVKTPKVEAPKTDTPKTEKTQPVNPFGDQIFKK